MFGDVLLHRLELLRSRGFPDSAEGVLRRKWEGNGVKGPKAKNGSGLRSSQASLPWGTDPPQVRVRLLHMVSGW